MELFHLTERANLKSILASGLKPKPNRLTRHGRKAIWLTNDVFRLKAVKQLQAFAREGAFKKPTILIVEVPDNMIHRFGKTGDYYSVVRIHPQEILRVYDYDIFMSNVNDALKQSRRK